MNTSLITLITVAIMMAYAIPGFLTVKTKLIKPESISAFAVVLLYVCQPSLTIYSFNIADYSWSLFSQALIFFALAFAIQAFMLGVCYLIFRKAGKQNVKYRIYSVACAFGNSSFLGIPLLEAIMPNHPEAVLLSTFFMLGMNILGWTVASAIITNDKKFISVKKAFFNPAVIALIVALPMFFTHTKLPSQLDSMFTLLGKMTTPLCMLIMGMRLATIKPKALFCVPSQYLIIGIKQLVMPLLAFAIVWYLPLDLFVRQTLFILCATPVASVVLNFSELLGEGQEHAANLLLLGTALSIATIPLLMLLL